MQRQSIVFVAIAVLLGFMITFLITGIAGSLLSVPQSTANATGQKIFLDRCSSCHAIDISASNGFGPNIATIGQEAATRIPELNAAEFILQSVLEPEAYRQPGVSGHMPRGIASGLSPKQLRDLIAYTAALGADHNSDEVANLKIDPDSLKLEQRVSVSLALLRRGETLFFKELGCSTCHSIYGEPGSSLLAPSLAHASRLSPEYVKESILNPSVIIAAGYRQVSLTTDTGLNIDGRLINERPDTLSVLSRLPGEPPKIKQILRSSIVDLRENEVSGMPPYNLSNEDESALVAFLGFLEAETSEP